MGRKMPLNRLICFAEQKSFILGCFMDLTLPSIQKKSNKKPQDGKLIRMQGKEREGEREKMKSCLRLIAFILCYVLCILIFINFLEKGTSSPFPPFTATVESLFFFLWWPPALAAWTHLAAFVCKRVFSVFITGNLQLKLINFTFSHQNEVSWSTSGILICC